MHLYSELSLSILSGAYCWVKGHRIVVLRMFIKGKITVHCSVVCIGIKKKNHSRNFYFLNGTNVFDPT